MAPETLHPAPPSTTFHFTDAVSSSGPSSTIHHSPRAPRSSTSTISIFITHSSGGPWRNSSTIPKASPSYSSLLAASDYPPIADSHLPKRGFPSISLKSGVLSTPMFSNLPPPSSLPDSSVDSLPVLSEQTSLQRSLFYTLKLLCPAYPFSGC